MLLRSSSTGVLSSLVVVDSVPELFSPVRKTSVPSTPTQEARDSDHDSGGQVPWRAEFRKVQSESDLQALSRTNSNSSSALAAANSLIHASDGAVAEKQNVEASTVAQKAWNRRAMGGTKRRCSLTVIPSARHMEVDEGLSELAEDPSWVDSGDRKSMSWLSQESRETINELGRAEISSLGTSSGSSLRNTSGRYFETVWDEAHDDGFHAIATLPAETASFSGRLAELSVGLTPLKIGTFGFDGGFGARDSFLMNQPTDLGFGNGGTGGAHKLSGGGNDGGGGDGRRAEAHYRKQLELDPQNPLLLRNYAKFLHEVVKDPHRAEVYYERAILANPGDAEVLGAYASLVWEVHRDADRAERYFEQALEISPDDCYLNGAYSAFLWSADDGSQEVDSSGGFSSNSPYMLSPTIVGTVAASA